MTLRKSMQRFHEHRDAIVFVAVWLALIAALIPWERL